MHKFDVALANRRTHQKCSAGQQRVLRVPLFGPGGKEMDDGFFSRRRRNTLQQCLMQRLGDAADALGVDRAGAFAQFKTIGKHAGFAAAFPITKIVIGSKASQLIREHMPEI